MMQPELGAGGWWTKVCQLGQRGRRLWLIAGVLLVLGMIAGALGVKPFIRSQARGAAAQRGVLLAVGEVSLGLSSITLDNVRLSLKDVDVLRGDIERLRVSFGWNLRPKAIDLTGGEVRLTGSSDQIAEQIESWRGRRGSALPTARAAAGPSLSATGLLVSWKQGGESPTAARLTGVNYSRLHEGPETFSVQTLSATLPGVSLSVNDAALAVDTSQGRRVLQQLSVGELNAKVIVSQISLAPKPKAPQLSTTPKQRQAPPAPRSTRLSQLLPSVDPERGTRARRAVAHLAGLARAKLPAASKVKLEKLNVTLVHGDQQLHLGPNQFRLERHSDRVEVALLPGSQQARTSPLALKLTVPFDNRAVHSSISGGPVSLASLGVRAGDFSLQEVERSQLALNSELTLASSGGSLDVIADGRLAPLSFHNKALSKDLLRGTALSWNAKARALLDGTRYEIERWEMALGDIAFTVNGVIDKSSERVTAELTGGIPLASCQSLLESAPDGLLPLLRGLKFAGTFALDAAVSFDSADLEKMKVKWDFRNECRVIEVPLELSPRRFLNEFRLQVKDATGRIVSIQTGPGTLGWTTYTGISPHMETAVLISEDGRFFRHQGFDREAIENSIKENVKAGRFVRGASTISMQLAKNLYLSFDKTFSRKLQEAVLTTLLEQELSKQEMMELYLNVIEYGPGVYGVSAAAKHYFNTTPAELSLGQALYLASILPNPQQQHFTESGALSDGWQQYLKRLMRIAVKIGRLSEAEYEAALTEEVRFGEASVSPQGGMFLPDAPTSDPDTFGERDVSDEGL